MNKKHKYFSLAYLTPIVGLLFLNACSQNNASQKGLEIKFLVGSALEEFCNQAADRLNGQNPKLDNGKQYYLQCEAKGSGDVVTTVVSLAQQLKQGSIEPENPQFPSLISLDGEIYHSQLLYQINQLFPGQNYIPEITDAPLLTNSPMVLMVSSDVAPIVRKQADIYQALEKAKNYKDLDPNGSALPIYFVHSAPTRSNSGLQTLVTQFASVSGQRPEQLTVADVQKYQPQVQQIQTKVTRYGISTNSLAEDMVKNGPFWASIGSVYESSVIAANSNQPAGSQTRYEAVYPKATFTSNMRAIIPNAPWMTEDEKAAVAKIVDYLRTPEVQKIATDLGLRPGVPGIELGAKFSPQFGVDPNAKYDSLRPPQPQVVEAMLKSWQEYAKKPSQVVIVVDSSGSMTDDKLPSVQNTLNTYIQNLGPKEKIVLIDFDSEIRSPVIVEVTPSGRDQGLQFVASLQADGGTKLYDSTLSARNWLQKNIRSDAINAIVVLTDGEDSESNISLDQLNAELEKSGFGSDQRIAVFTIGYGKEGEFNPQILKTIAGVNGGYYLQGDPATIANLMSDLQTEF